MTQLEALSILKTGANIFLTGEPGSGKTYLINQYVAYLRQQKIELAITASTGIAATHIGGMTIHSWSGIGIKKKLTKYDLDKIISTEYLYRRINKARVLIIDEISMLSAETFNMIEAVCRAIKQSPGPFGGLQVILVGDFFQLPPVLKKDDLELEQNKLFKSSEGCFAFESKAWHELNPLICYLTEQYRQDDLDFLSILSAIRQNKILESHLNCLNKRFLVKESCPENITKLFSHNADVDAINHEMLGKIKESPQTFKMLSRGPEHLVEALKRGCLSSEIICLKKGAVVMCTKNNFKDGFVNGTFGVIKDFNYDGGPIIQTKSGKIIEIKPMDWTLEENGQVKAKISQIPLRLAWAITVHKSQGMSLDVAVMDLSRVFEYGQGYVALSRLRRLDGLYLLGLNEMVFKVHPEILAKDSEFQASSSEVKQIFGQINLDELQKLHKNFIIALGGRWLNENEIKSFENKPKEPVKLEKIRFKHKNAYRPWTKAEEERLKKEFENGFSLKKLSEIFGRQTGGIRSRLIKLGLIEES